jgi:transcriptional regulator with XRE-family HTH domain
MEMTAALYQNPFGDLLSSWRGLLNQNPVRTGRYPGFGFEAQEGVTTSGSTIFSSFIDEYSSPTLVRFVPSRETAFLSYPELSVQVQVRLVLGKLGLSKSDLAKILGVTRPTLYAWLDGRIEPKSENASRLAAIASIVNEDAGLKDQPLFHAYIERRISGYSLSLLEALSEPSLDTSLIKGMIAKIRMMTSDRNNRIGKGRVDDSFAAPTGANEERILEENLMAIGPED